MSYFRAIDPFPLESAEHNRLHEFYARLGAGTLVTTRCGGCGRTAWPPRNMIRRTPPTRPRTPLDVPKKPTGGLTKSSPKPPTNGFDMKSGGKFSAGASSNNSSSPGGSKGPVRQIIGRINSALSGLANGQTHNEKKDSADSPGPHSP